jgi:C1A family cysteine protease
LADDQTAQLVDLAQAALPPGVAFSQDDEETYGLGAMDEPRDDESGGPQALSFAPLPARVDLHEHMPAIKNQGRRGTCVSFACTAVREYLLGVDNGGAPGLKDLSEQFLYWNCKKHDGYPGAGTYISVGMDALLHQGQPPEEIWPYNSEIISGNEGQDPPPFGAAEQAVAYCITETEVLPARSVDALRQNLAEGLPVAFAVPVYSYWFSEPIRSTGDIRLPLPGDRLEGGHAMCMVGYEDDPNVPGGGYFMIRNSWGTTWAAANSIAPGYARLPYAYMAEYASAAHTARAGVTPKPAPKPAPQKGFFQKVADFFRKLFGG